MRKLLSILFVLVSFNCFGLAPKLEEALNIEFYESGSSRRVLLLRYKTVAEKLQEAPDSLQKELLKVNLAIESSIVEDCIISDLKFYKECITRHEEEGNMEIVEILRKEMNLLNKKLQVIRQSTKELLQY